ncbi:MAG: YCF48-related protein [Spirosomataceae bacterium]
MKKFLLILVTILAFFLNPSSAEASHFRYGQITWTRVPGTRTVNFTITTAWRHDASESINFNYGDGNWEAGVLGTEIQYVANSYRVYELHLTHTYTTDGPFVAYFNDCCRISTLQNAPDGYYTVSNNVCLSNNNQGSPSCTSPTVIEMKAGVLNQYQLLASDPDGTAINYSINAIRDGNYVPTVGGNSASVSPTGLISWSPVGAVAGQLYQMKVSMSDGCTQSEIDFIIKITSCTSAPASGTLSGTKSILLGESTNLTLALAGTPPWTYRLSGTTTDVTTSTSTVSIPVTPPNAVGLNTYTISSLSNACGLGPVTGNAMISVEKPLELIACFPFNGNAQDSKGTHHGIVSGATLTSDRFGNPNSAYNFNGTNSFIQLTNAEEFKNPSYSYSLWVKCNIPTSGSNLGTVLGVGNLQNLQLTVAPSWNMTSALTQDGSSYYTSWSAGIGLSIAEANQWHQLTVVRTIKGLELYYDGRLWTSGFYPNSGISLYENLNDPNAPIYRATIGALPDITNTDFFNGQIDDIKIYNNVLNANQVKALYLAEQSCPNVETGGLIALTSLSNPIACAGKNITATVITNNISPTNATPIIIQLSDVTGSFNNPTQIGTGTNTSIVCSIPQATLGGNYKIRAIFNDGQNQLISVNTLTLTINALITTIPSITNQSGNLCYANSMTLAATGCANNNYVWSDGQTGSSIVVSPTATKSYRVACFATPCTGDSSNAFLVTIVSKPVAPSITTPNSTICGGLSLSLTASGCTGGTYAWTGGLTGNTVSVSPSVTKSYKTVCIQNGCASDSSLAVIVTVNPKPNKPTISISNSTICSGASATLTASGCTSGSYIWSIGLIGATITVAPTTNTNYKVICKSGTCYGDSSLTATVTVIPKPVSPTIITSATSICPRSSTTLSASGCSSGTYKWTDGYTGSSITVTPSSTKTYKVVCSLNSSCVSDSSSGLVITVLQRINPPFITTTSQTVCSGQNVSIVASGCVGGTYAWTGGLSGAIITVSPTVTTSYKAVCIQSGCTSDSSSASILTINNTLAGFTISSNKTPLCTGDTATLTATGCPIVPVWSNNQSGNSIQVAPITTSTYSVTCSVGGCNYVQQYTLATINSPAISASSTNLQCGQTSLLSATNISANNQVQWRKDGINIQGATGNSYTASTAGKYDFTSYLIQTTPQVSTNNSIYTTSFLNDNIGLVGSIFGVFKTTNGGTTWTQVYNNTGTITSIQFVTSSIVWAVGNNGNQFCIKSIDGGNTWTPVAVNAVGSFKKISFKDATNGIIVGDFGLIYTTSDGGASWSLNNQFAGSNYATILSAAFVPNSSTIGIVGAVYSSSFAAISTDNGISYQRKALNSFSATSLSDIAFTTNQTGFISGNNGTLLKTSDGGTSWQPASTPLSGTNAEFRDIEFVNAQVGYVTGFKYATPTIEGFLLKTTDGGNTWQYMTLPSYAYYTLSFSSENTGWLTYENYLIKYSTPQCPTIPITITNSCCSIFESVKSGNWSDTSTWSCGRVPTFTDDVIIKHSITTSTGNIFAKSITYMNNGVLDLQNNTLLKVGN